MMRSSRRLAKLIGAFARLLVRAAFRFMRCLGHGRTSEKIELSNCPNMLYTWTVNLDSVVANHTSCRQAHVRNDSGGS